MKKEKFYPTYKHSKETHNLIQLMIIIESIILMITIIMLFGTIQQNNHIKTQLDDYFILENIQLKCLKKGIQPTQDCLEGITLNEVTTAIIIKNNELRDIVGQQDYYKVFNNG